MSERGRTIREAIAVALEGLPGTLDSWLFDRDAKTIRAHVVEWVLEYGFHRGVILDAKQDIEPEIRKVIEELRSVAITRTKTPR